MNFGKNLQHFRKAKGLSQEELAEKMGLSRQAIGKWESGGGYPEAEKLIELCEVLDCNMDALVRGDEGGHGADRSIKGAYVKLMDKFSRSIAIAVGLVLLGVTGFVVLASFGEEYADYGLVLLLGFIMVSVPIFVARGIEMCNFKEKHVRLEEFFSEAEVESYNERFARFVAGAISTILAGLVVFMALMVTNVFGEESSLPAAVFLGFVSVAVPILVYAGIQKGKYDIRHYNEENSAEFKAATERTGRYSGVIMLFATIIFLVLGILLDAWAVCWLVFPVGGMLCGVVAMILKKD